jgi:hypothetical protein
VNRLALLEAISIVPVYRMVVNANDTPNSAAESETANAAAPNVVAGPSSDEHEERKKHGEQGEHESIETGI